MQTVFVQTDGSMLRAQINRPDANNSINDALLRDLTNALDDAVEAENVRVFVLEGLPDVFCTGNDFDALAHARDDQLSRPQDVAAYFDLLAKLTTAPLITTALVRGRVNAGGIGLVAACDLVVADRGASFGLSEMLFGLLPACVLPFLGRRIGPQRARLMALTTQPIDCATAADWGLVDEVSEDAERIVKLRASRFGCLSAEAIVRLKRYTDQLWPVDQRVRQVALDTITPLINDPRIRANIRHFIQDGVYPWQTSTSESLD